MGHVRTGLDRLLSERLSLLRGRRVGLLANPTSLDRELRHAADLLVAAGVELVALFGPEHGVRGEAQDMVGVETSRDPRLGIPVHSLYGASPETLTPSTASLSGIDLLCVDLQDIGSRYYTYVWTMTLALEACARAGVPVLVLDRPNPLGGETVEGPGIARGYESFVGLHDVPVRHGLTIGELARLCASERGLAVELEVIELEGWRREQCFDQTGLPWVLPSPNMPTLETAFVYPGGCLLEGTNLSEGRGTTRPFEILGAPWIEAATLCAALEEEDLPGVRFRPLAFRPSFQKHAGEVCGGLQLHLVDRARFRSLRTGVALLHATFRLWPELTGWRREAYEFVRDRPAIDLLAGGDWLRAGVEAGARLQDLARGWEAEERAWRERRQPWLLYE
jgi:uncharacterized protein YbbC (DUF1343 family)